ncbi:serine hydrolase [Bacteroidia bacterium]|nr:serine hydrolase [Bacteroidia bacterium]
MKVILSSVITLLLASCSVGIKTREERPYPTDERITSVLSKYVDNQDLAGIIAVVADGDSILSLDCLGYSDVENKKPMNPTTLFWIASQSKPVTSVAVMMLAEEGLLNLDEPIATYLPELSKLYAAQDAGNDKKSSVLATTPITLRLLLTHTSGMTWVGGVQQQAGHIDVLPFHLSLYVTAMTPLLSEPGTKYSYSNQGINVCATIVERVSGKSFDQFLQERLFDPLGMPNTTFWPTDEQLANYIPPYKKDANGKLIPVPLSQLQYPLGDKTKRYPEAAGGLFSTPVDLVKFFQMIANGGVYQGKRYLSDASVSELGKNQIGGNIEATWGLGWSITGEYLGHGGACGTESRVYKNTRRVLMYITQEDGLPANETARKDFFETASLR